MVEFPTSYVSFLEGMACFFFKQHLESQPQVPCNPSLSSGWTEIWNVQLPGTSVSPFRPGDFGMDFFSGSCKKTPGVGREGFVCFFWGGIASEIDGEIPRISVFTDGQLASNRPQQTSCEVRIEQLQPKLIGFGISDDYKGSGFNNHKQLLWQVCRLYSFEAWRRCLSVYIYRYMIYIYLGGGFRYCLFSSPFGRFGFG